MVRPSRLLSLAASSLLLTVAVRTAAFAPRAANSITPAVSFESSLVLTAVAHERQPLRTIVAVDNGPGSAGSQRATRWSRFVATNGADWSVNWDRATDVARQVWGKGHFVAGSMADSAVAALAARASLAANIELLAPGSAPGDFVLVSNVSDGDMRTVGFVQMHQGLRVIDGQVSFRFKRDRLFVMSSQAAPYVKVANAGQSRVTKPVMHARVAGEFAALGVSVSSISDSPSSQSLVGADEILPLIGDAGVLGYRRVTPLLIDGGDTGRYTAWVDPSTGDVIARRSERRYADGTLRYLAVDRHPLRPYVSLPASSAFVTVNGTALTTSLGGQFSWTPEAATTVTATTNGRSITVNNMASDNATTSLPISPGGTALWDASASEQLDAQVQTFVHNTVAKQYIETFLPGEVNLTSNVNLDRSCNAFFDYSDSTTNFFLSSDECANTGQLADVIYHETGHWLHTKNRIGGAGGLDVALSEGVSDFLVASITGDSGTGRGFYFTDEPMRELDPPDSEASWPTDAGGPHQTGIIFGATFWDLRKLLIANLGEAEGITTVNRLYLGVLRRAVDIPSSLIEVLAVDDDDGDLSNGTPNECAIRTAYGTHGMRTAFGTITAPGVVIASDNEASTLVRFDVRGETSRCVGEVVAQAELIWAAGSDGVPSAGRTDSTSVVTADGRHFTAELPLPADYGGVDYQLQLTFADGGTMSFPDNVADPYYRMSRGASVPLYCTSFDENPFDDHWTQGGDDPEWRWGSGGTGTNNPATPFTGDNFLRIAPIGNNVSSGTSWIQLPRIDVGTYTDVRLQYRRWAGVDDYDRATILANGTKAWDSYQRGGLRHVDREWRYSEVPLSAQFQGPYLDLRFQFEHDNSFVIGGWNLDDLCVVANPNSVCGDGQLSGSEVCDDGAANSNQPDSCRTTCQPATCGDGIVDSNEDCEPGTDPRRCSQYCKSLDSDGSGGCNSTNHNSGTPTLFCIVIGIGVLGRRHRRFARATTST